MCCEEVGETRYPGGAMFICRQPVVRQYFDHCTRIAKYLVASPIRIPQYLLRLFTGLLYTSKAAAFRLSRAGTLKAHFGSGRGPGNHTRAIAILQPGTSFHPISSAERPCTSAIHVSILYDPVHAFRVVNQWPSVEDQNSKLKCCAGGSISMAAVRSFIEDGHITQSVVWEVTTSDERAHTSGQVMRSQGRLGTGDSFVPHDPIVPYISL
ncbi:uncharacterized protein EDB91DRAFT_891174 [Suillus paluster]|uniref:uncharacterized protein n=1 Tax=Suillus paluster TaxID=48578 RepID=UPI001B86143E|nr:uncharacterized protein EDB91DRAFT_891174 [Suillus paluster]KAG1727450.1 hypothetical protein EDB91DRAFT_891174 [Suillus paluster]